MELAKLFATVGFKVDKDGLTEFRKEMADLKVNLKSRYTNREPKESTKG